MATFTAPPARCSRPASARATSCITRSPITSHLALSSGSPASGRWAARWFRVGSAIPRCKSRRSPISSPSPMAARRISLRSCSIPRRTRARTSPRSSVHSCRAPPLRPPRGARRGGLAARGVETLQCYATAEVGVIAYETPARDGMVINEHLIVEIVRPGTGDPVPEGEVGEVVVTSFNADYPMIRLATGDLSAVLPGTSPCGRTNMRIKGWMGRADQTTKIKGMFVHPSALAEIGNRHPELARLRLAVTRAGEHDVMTLLAECAAPTAGLAEALAATLQAVTKLRGEVKLVAPGSLPNDGKVIADERPVG